jgi:uncharacterized membrane-anchored protein
MAMLLVRMYRPRFGDTEELTEWIVANAAAPERDGLWVDDDQSKRLWAEFVERWGERAGGRWAESMSQVGVQWVRDEEKLSSGQPVQLIHQFERNATAVYGQDLTLRGLLEEPLPSIGVGFVRAFVGTDPNVIRIERFSPRG